MQLVLPPGRMPSLPHTTSAKKRSDGGKRNAGERKRRSAPGRRNDALSGHAPWTTMIKKATSVAGTCTARARALHREETDTETLETTGDPTVDMHAHGAGRGLRPCGDRPETTMSMNGSGRGIATGGDGRRIHGVSGLRLVGGEIDWRDCVVRLRPLEIVSLGQVRDHSFFTS
ncbi:uncharacterized protein LAESUDRAFT_309876 [Laetiporus sulphureus 93-53]|uniref:Uncharacterized protein n=1 Tax=Laetiporus sulphureus 93-53 TaxID=1314785 RepID=A0A165D473_9APHY|nr:uncharacterized protein LAESUDRAFT_309876 [Laetiporus sulphureus 93-53]KZT04121.1 hypothetical protein LAESUDRAFT_309876 [Laetiporus sulphureus 93-53]